MQILYYLSSKLHCMFVSKSGSQDLVLPNCFSGICTLIHRYTPCLQLPRNAVRPWSLCYYTILTIRCSVQWGNWPKTLGIAMVVLHKSAIIGAILAEVRIQRWNTVCMATTLWTDKLNNTNRAKPSDYVCEKIKRFIQKRYGMVLSSIISFIILPV